MTDFAIYISRLSNSTDSLRHVDDALRFFTGSNSGTDTTQAKKHANEICAVIRPLLASGSNHLSAAMTFNERLVSENLQKRHTSNWQQFLTGLDTLCKRLEKGELTLYSSDVSALNDVADALDLECEELFKRINARY